MVQSQITHQGVSRQQHMQADACKISLRTMQLRVCALFCTLAVPLIGLAILAACHTHLLLPLLLYIILPTLALAELLFVLLYTAAYRRLDKITTPPPELAHCQEVFARFLKLDSMQHYIDFPSVLSKWHWNVPFHKLHATHVAAFISYGLFYRKTEDWAAEGYPDVPEQLVQQLEAAWGMTFSREIDPVTGLPPAPLPFMAHLWEPVRCHYRPAIFYVSTTFLCVLTRLIMCFLDFKAHSHPGGYVYYTHGLPHPKLADSLTPFLVRNSPDRCVKDRQLNLSSIVAGVGGIFARAKARSLCNSDTYTTSSSCASGLDEIASGDSCSSIDGGSVSDSGADFDGGAFLPGPVASAQDGEPDCISQAPLLFLHGVGLGLLPYMPLIMRLVATGRPLVAVESPHLSMRLVGDVPEVDTVVEALVQILDGLQLPSVGVVAHSYGTFMASRLVQRSPSRVRSMTLLDPCTFNMFTGQLIHSFVYHNPSKGANMTTWFVAREMAHAASVCRRFYWTKLNLWPDQLPRHTLVVLSERDELVAVRETCTMLRRESPGTILLVHPTHRHGDFIHDLAWQDTIVASMHTMDISAVREAGLAVAAADKKLEAVAVGEEAHKVVKREFDLMPCIGSPALGTRSRGGGCDAARETSVHQRNDSAEGTEGMVGSTRHMILRSRKVVV